MLASRNSRFGSMERRKLSDVILIYRVSKRPGSFRNRSKGGSTVRVKNLPTNETGNRVTDEYYFHFVVLLPVLNLESHPISINVLFEQRVW